MALKNAVLNSMNDIVLLDCYFHFIETIKRHIPKTEATNLDDSKASIMRDLYILHSSRSENEYQSNLCNIENKWKAGSEQLQNFSEAT